jgi:Cytochrome c554 and c-prime
MRLASFFASLALISVLAFAAWKEIQRPKAVAITPTLTGMVEYCVTCHADIPEISPSHPLDAFGCVTCHGGDGLSLDKDLAHKDMRGGANPSALEVVQASCGGDTCHNGPPEQQRDHIQRVTTSIQSTYAGAIAQMRYAFGAQPDLKARMGIYAIDGLAAFTPTQEKSPALQTFSKNCLNCHISAQPLSGSQYARFSGCSACHSPAPIEQDQSVHKLTTAIPYIQCNTCHNRGNYSLGDIQFHPRTDQPSDRLHDYYQPIAQFTRCEYTLDCADCHTRYEIMGDGQIHGSKKDIQYIQCRTCHGTLTELPLTHTISDPNDLALRMAFLDPVIDLKIGDTILVTNKDEPLWNTRLLPDGNYELYGKASRQKFIFRPVMGSACQQNPEQQESQYCHTCHAVER